MNEESFGNYFNNKVFFFIFICFLSYMKENVIKYTYTLICGAAHTWALKQEQLNPPRRALQFFFFSSDSFKFLAVSYASGDGKKNVFPSPVDGS